MPAARHAAWASILLTVGALAFLGSTATATTGTRVDARPIGSCPVPRPSDAFGWLVARAAPAAWRHHVLPGGDAVLSYPPDFRKTRSDPGAFSAALLRHGAYASYLNATPRQGGERLHGWARFRVGHLLEDDASSVHEVATVEMRRFLGGNGSCVIDDYVTRVGSHQFHEIACLVSGSHHESVVIAAVSSSEWARLGPTVERAVAGYAVR